ncbi:TetR/AcrR family transcriptional regulator [Pseudothermotoga hypogea]
MDELSSARERILEAAKAAFSERGFDGVSMEEIAQRAGVRKPLIYYYFPSKEVLFEEVWNRALEELENHIFKEVENENYYVRKIKRFLRAYIDFVTSRKVLSKVIEKERASVLDESGQGDVWKRLKRRYDDFLNRVAQLIEEGKKNELVNPEIDSQTAAKLITEALAASTTSGSVLKSIESFILSGLMGRTEP